MTPENEKKLLSSLYDRLFDAVTHAPEGKSAPWHKDTTFLQMSKNQVLNPDDFANMMSPMNPNGDMKAAAAFSAFVDAQPNTETLWADSGKLISETYGTIVNNANTNTTVNPEQQKIYDQAYNYLNTTVEKKDFTGAVKKVIEPSPTAIAYDDAQAAYITAVGGYRTAYNGYDLNNTKDQRAWNAVSPGLQLTVDQAWNAWLRADKAEVEQAQAALVSTINNAISYVIQHSQGLINAQHQLAPLSPGGNPWLPSFAMPSTWEDPSFKGVEFSMTSSYLNESSSSEATSYSASASGGWGLWHASAGVSGSSEKQTAHMDAQNVSIKAELINVSIKRPWFNPLLLGMNDWFMNGVEKGGISNADIHDLIGLMPIVPTGFVIARNVEISADFSEQDKSFVANSIATQASGGWGPFSVSGSYAHSSSKSKFESKFDGGTLKLPGLQVIAWINSIMPVSPPMDTPT